MRYRPLGNTGMSISSMSLVLSDSGGMREADWVSLIYAALESGINAFEITSSQPTLIDGVGQALQATEIAVALGEDVGIVIERHHGGRLDRSRDHQPGVLADLGQELHDLGVAGVETGPRTGKIGPLGDRMHRQ